MNFYKILNIKKLGRGSPDFWTRLFAKHTGGGSIKPVIVELTGKLPLMFITSDTKLHDWTIYGNNDVGKNLLEITAVSLTINDVVFTVDKQAGTVTANKENMTTATSVMNYHFYLPPGDYIFTCDDDAQRDITYDSYVRIPNATLARDNNNDAPGNSFTWGGGNVFIYHRIQRAYAENEHTFKPMIRKAGTSEAFEPYQVGVGERTKNLLEITGEDELVTRGITFTHDKSNHSIVVNGQATGNAFYACGDVTLKAGVQYVLNGCPAGGSYSDNTYLLYAMGHTDWGFDTGNGLVLPIMTEDTVITPRIGVYTGAGELTDLVFKPMLREANTTSDFIPYGYQIPLITMDAKTAEYVYRNNIFIGDSPLTEGESISKSSTGLDVKTIAIGADDYPNKLITSLSNKPEMTIKYKSKGGS